MSIFFTGAISGGRAHQPHYSTIIKILAQYGVVFSSHVSDAELSQYGETQHPAEEILTREQDALRKCDVVIAEVSTPSLGVGYLVGRATALHKKVIALYFGDDALKLSSIIKGDSGITVREYRTDGDIEKILAEAFSKDDL